MQEGAKLDETDTEDRRPGAVRQSKAVDQRHCCALIPGERDERRIEISIPRPNACSRHGRGVMR